MRLPVVVTLSLVAACSGGAPSAVPTAPTLARPPDATFTVSGVVFGQGSTPIGGARVGGFGPAGAITDSNGYYSVQGVTARHGGAYAVKEGYAEAREIVAVDRDMRLDFHLGPRAAIYTLSGIVVEETSTGFVPIEGVELVAFSCDDTAPIPPFFPGAGCLVSISQGATTDKNGYYRIIGLYSGKKNHLSASREGFDDPRTDEDAQEGSGHEGKGTEVILNGDTRIDLQLIRR